MLSNAITRRAAFVGLLMLAGCGFAPVYGPGGIGTQWQNSVRIEAPNTVFGYRMTAQLQDAFGPANAARFTLSVVPQTGEGSATVTEDGDITRFNVTGNATWVMSDLQGTQIADGLVQTFTSYSATGTTVATQSAQTDAEARLAVALADLIVQQVLLSGAAQ